MWWNDSIATQARALEASYQERRAQALIELQAKLLSELGQRVLAKASQGRSRCIVYFDQLYGSDLHNDPTLLNDFNDEEQAALELAVAEWCQSQGLTAERSARNHYKLTLRWAAQE